MRIPRRFEIFARFRLYFIVLLAALQSLKSLQKNRLNRRVSPSSGGLVGLSWRCQGLRWPDDSDFGPLELSGAHRLATPLGNLLLMPSPSPV